MKKNENPKVCIDFRDLNKALLKDSFPLLMNDTLVDAYSGYNQIFMYADDQEKISFMIDKGIYWYKVMPFGLKNTCATY